MEVLEFYTDQTKRNEAEYGTASLVPSSLPLIPSDSEGDRWANLMPRQQPAPPSSRPERPQRPERPDRPEDQLRPSIPERSQSVDTLPVTQRMSSLGLYDDRVSPLFLALFSLPDSVNVKKGSFSMYWIGWCPQRALQGPPSRSLPFFHFTHAFFISIADYRATSSQEAVQPLLQDHPTLFAPTMHLHLPL